MVKDADLYNFASQLRAIETVLRKISGQLEVISEKLSQQTVQVVAYAGEPCKHQWVLKTTSTAGMSYQCSVCSAWRTETW
jgi:hypothetical protein